MRGTIGGRNETINPDEASEEGRRKMKNAYFRTEREVGTVKFKKGFQDIAPIQL